MTSPAGFPAIDFSVCEVERIDAPGAIQNFGMLFALDRRTLRLSHISRNAAGLLAETPEAAIGKKPAVLAAALGLEMDLAAICRKMRAGADGSRVQAVEIARDDRASYQLSLGLGHFLLERRFEPANAPAPDEVDAWRDAFSARLAGAGENVFALAQRTTALVRDLIRFDRIMVYRFAADATGEVIAESRAHDMIPYLGLRYPATDIPAQARRLYLDNRLREIADTQALTEPLHPPCAADAPAPVDLSTSILRAISPYHLQYTSNMGVRATIVASLVVDGKLWGLIACHHRAPRLVAAAHRAALRAAADALSQSVALSLLGTDSRLRARKNEALAGIEQVLSTGGNSAHLLLEKMIVGTRADGAMLCRGAEVIAVGSTPFADALPSIGQLLSEGARDGIIAVDNLGRFLNAPDSPLQNSAGAAGIVAPGDPPILLVAFRDEFVHSVTWGGDPRHAAEVDPVSGSLSPRNSFASWRETVTGTSRPWDEHVAAFLRGLLEMRAFHGAASRMNADMRALRDDLANHDALRTAVMNVTLDGMTLALAADVDGSVRIVSGNRAFIMLFDLQPEECRTIQLADLVGRLGIYEPLASLPAVSDIVAWSPAQGPRNIVLRRRSVLDTLFDGARRNWDIYIFQDVTEMRRREEALAAAFEHTLGEVRARTEFLANMSHELRTPLNAVLGFSEVIASSMYGPHSNPKYEEYGQNIHGAGTHLLDLIDRLLVLSQIEARKRVLAETVFDLCGLVDECAAWVREQPGNAKPAITVENPIGAVSVFADALALRQIAINLIGNAAKFTPADGVVTITVDTDEMGAPRMIVRDNGPGIAADILPQLFQPFRQGEGAYARSHGGVGLGLSIVKGLIQLHGGTVRLTSGKGTGTEVIVLLPAARRR
jgi:light-regulated signal transduction histidine kinase (bacteriophytochrome)